MSPQDLLSMLERNRADLQQAGGGGGGGPVGTAPRYPARNALAQLVAAAASLLTGSARRHPRLFVAVAVGLGLALHVAWSAPRNGLVLSSLGGRRSMLTSGPTTVWMPPAECCRREVLRSDAIPWSDRPAGAAEDPLDAAWMSSMEDVLVLLETLRHQRDEDADDVTAGTLRYQWLDRKALKRMAETPDLQQAAVGRAKLTADELLGAPSSSSSAPDGSAQQRRYLVSELALDAARDVLHHQQLTEFSPRVKYHSQERRGVLVVAGMGDWGRVGLLPLVAAVSPRAAGADLADPDGEEEGSSSLPVHLVLKTVPGYHWDGEIHVVVSRDDESDDVLVQVGLVVPPKGRAISKSVAEAIVTAFVESISTSIRTRTRQNLSRSRQSSSFQRHARDRAGRRRQSRQRKERELEEMAADRRRRWQRQNPNAGHYRPSGDRMRSPNNAVYH
jgi:hypothetical protein